MVGALQPPKGWITLNYSDIVCEIRIAFQFRPMLRGKHRKVIIQTDLSLPANSFIRTKIVFVLCLELNCR